jgi:hypothetical protein
MELQNELSEHIEKSKQSFSYFLEHIFPLSFKESDRIVKAPHTFNWANRIQNNKRTATLSARKHLKSITMYAWVMWRLLRLTNSERGYYMSYTQDMSIYHTKNIKSYIQANPLFSGIIDLSRGSSNMDYLYKGNRFIVEATGIGTFNRGRHCEWVVCDDILQDPTSELNFNVIEKINKVFFEEVMSIPREGGEIHLVGTSQHDQDLFFKILRMVNKDREEGRKDSWNWEEYKGILNETDKLTLWPELFPYERMVQLREELGERAFSKEYMCSPVWSEGAYFKREELMKVVGYEYEGKRYATETIKRPASEWKVGRIVGGLDIGKKVHPSHISIFTQDKGIYTMIYEKFMFGWDYTKQIEFINGLIDYYLIDEIRYDNTRGEFESFKEQHQIDTRIYRPIVFGTKVKFQMASNFSKNVNNKTIRLINSQPMLNSILSVNEDLDAPDTEFGHGDAFWSVAMALYEAPKGGGYISI